MSTFEELFNASTLEVLVPPASFALPATGPADCLEQLKSTGERKTAFFDEKLHFLLALHLPSTEDASASPPATLISFLSYLQVSYEASYIPSIPAAPRPEASPMRLSAPPRTMSLKNQSKLNLSVNANANKQHPSIFPPHTPNPTPGASGEDRRYVQAEGTLLSAGTWGEEAPNTKPGSTPVEDEDAETFALLYSEKDKEWIAVYRLVVTVAFLRIPISDPLLCLTVSTTLRENPLPNPPAFLASFSSSPPPDTPVDTDGQGNEEDEEEGELAGLTEVNLLEGLASGPTFPPLDLPSTRLPPTTRQTAFSLPPVPSSPSSPSHTSPSHPSSPSSKSSSRRSSYRLSATQHPTLRKSHRKTLPTLSGFRVRLRSVLVPSAEEEGEERTVVLCVEVENPPSSFSYGFAVERVEVAISGPSASARLVGWGAREGDGEEEKVFPLLVGAAEQFNLLYAVSFHEPGEGREGMQRAVAITIHGRPFHSPTSLSSQEHLMYPTRSFASRWNCIVDLSPERTAHADMVAVNQDDALPAPASPFPQVSTPRTATPFTAQEKPAPVSQQVAGSKRHTLAALAPTTPKSSSRLNPTNYRSSTSLLNPSHTRDSLSPAPRTAVSTAPRSSFLPPSLVLQQSAPRTPTTFSPRIPSPPLPRPPSTPTTPEGQYARTQVPPTPAYPAYPNSPVPPTPYSQGPMGGAGSVAPSVEIRRERGLAAGGGGQGQVPPTPAPWVTAGGAGGGMAPLQSIQTQADKSVREPIVVSIGLLHDEEDEGREGRIYPLDRFTLDIFVFNQSSWIRRFEVSYPPRARRRLRESVRESGGYFPSVTAPVEKERDTGPGIMPLENRVRVGPLRPETCQSVRMEFLALAPGVHTIDTLVLTDIESGKSMNLRSVMDIVVHDPSGI